VALVRPDVVVQAIVDNVHLAPETSRAAQLAARERFALVTDAIEASAVGPGTYRRRGRAVCVTGAEARLDDGTLAGSVLTMDAAVRNLVGLGARVEDALQAAARVPATLVGRSELASLEPGTPADIVVLEDSLEVRKTLVGGEEAYAGP
jgi:N-acetylglucosamine-6-phosphate deacetylase